MDVSSPKMDYWNNSPASQCSNYERMGFNASANDDSDYSFSSRRKIARDPMSHRIIEKRRRDRMNNCLADLSRLLPASFLKKGRGRIEKTEIIEMAIKHLKYLQAHASSQSETCEIAASIETRSPSSEQYRLGYQDCISELINFLVEVEGFFAEDAFCLRLVSHLQKQFDFLSSGEVYNSPEARCSSISSGCSLVDVKVNGTSSTSSSEEVAGGSSSSSSSTNSMHSAMHCEDKSDKLSGRKKNDHLRSNKDAGRSCEGSGSRSSPGSSSPSFKNLSSPETNVLNQDPDNCGSQLREMLLASNPDNCQKKLSSHSDDNSGMYKFKSNIHQRFAAEHIYPSASKTSSGCDQENGCEEPKRRRMLEESFIPASCRKEDEDSSSKICYEEHPENPSSPHYTVLSSSSTATLKNGRSRSAANKECPGSHPDSLMPAEHPAVSRSLDATPAAPGQLGLVPIFALHPQGSYYIPMSLETSLVVPLLENAVEGPGVPVLHPISISVNFSHPARTITSKQLIYQNHPPAVPTVNNHHHSSLPQPVGPSEHSVWKGDHQSSRSAEKQLPRTHSSSTEELLDKVTQIISPTREPNVARLQQLRSSRQGDYQHQSNPSSRWSHLMAANKRHTS